jgi:hypothetical protein
MMEVFEHPDHVPMWTAAARGEPVDWDVLYQAYHATVDWPSAYFWRQLAAHYPAAKVILSRRSPDSWYESVSNTIYQAMTAWAPEDPALRARLDMARDIVLDRTFGGRFEDREHAIAVYERHNAEVQDAIEPGRLLVFEAAQGWEPLCAFLGVAVPAEPFPRVNTTDDFRARRMPRNPGD